ncbi:MAG: aldose epimerase, partial [Gaiellales bacterium]
VALDTLSGVADRYAGRPLLLVLGPSCSLTPGMSGAEELLGRRPDVGAILIADDLSTEVFQRAMRSGVRDVLGAPVDTAFTDLARDSSGRATVRLTAPDGSGTELWVDSGYPWLQLFTGDSLALERRRRGIAVEPMTAPANAFRSGTDLIRLEPGERSRATWGLRALA